MRRLALFSAGFALATAFYVYILTDMRALWLAGGCLILSAVCIYLCIGRCGAVLLGVAAGLIWCFAYCQIWLAPAEQVLGQEQTVSMQVLDLPEQTLYGTKISVRLPLENRKYRAILYGEQDLASVRPGDTIRCTVQIESAARSPDGGELFLETDGTALLLYARSAPEVEAGTAPLPMALRLWLQERICELYGSDEVPLLLALITGDRREMSYSLRNDLSVAGLSHAVAVSGLHVSVLLSAITLFCGYNPRLTAIFGIPMVILFALMTGASPSALRAAVMQILMLTAPLARRENDPPTNLAAAALLLLLQNPWAITSVSFQLSFAAVAGLLLFSRPIQQKLLALREKPGRLWRLAVSSITASLSATIVTLPLTVYYFGMISVCAPLSNLLALWALNALLVLGLLSCLPGGIGLIFAGPVRLLCRYILQFTGTIASFPYAGAYPQNLPLMIWAVLAYGIAVFWLLSQKKRGWPLWVMAVGLLGCLFWGRWSLTHHAPVFRVLDVGQGQCILFESGNFTAVIDCGGSYPDKAGETAARTLHSGGQTHVDAVVVTHYDSDHAGGVCQLLHRVSAGLVFLPDTPDETGTRQTIERAALEAGAEVIAVSTLTEVTFSDGKLTIYPPISRENDNNAGICVLATAGKYDMLVTGDLDEFAEMRLLSRWTLPQVEILAAGHHGARTSTGQTLLEATAPQTVVISVGANNTYGHPDPETLARIADAGAEIYRTDTEGTIVIRGR